MKNVDHRNARVGALVERLDATDLEFDMSERLSRVPGELNPAQVMIHGQDLPILGSLRQLKAQKSMPTAEVQNDTTRGQEPRHFPVRRPDGPDPEKKERAPARGTIPPQQGQG